MPKTIPPLALLQEKLTITARCGVSKMFIACHAICMNAHDIQITVSETTDITKLLNNIPLSMNCVIGKPTSLRARPKTIGCHSEDFSSPDKHRYVKTDDFTLAKTHRVRIHKELLNKCVIARADRSCHCVLRM